MKADEEIRHDLVGDGYDIEPLLTAEEVGKILRVPAKSVYDLPLPRIRLGSRRIRWRPCDVRAFIDRRIEAQCGRYVMATRRANGVFYIKRRFKSIGPVYRSLGTKRKTQADALENVLVKLHDRGRLDLVVAFLDGEVAIEELAESFETSRIPQLTIDLNEQNSPLSDACTEALRLKAPDVTASTLERYQDGLKHFQRFVGGLTVREALAQEKIQEFKSARLGEGVARETLNNDLIAISILATHALDSGWIDKRPKLKRYKATTRINYLEPTQLDTYFAALRAPFRPFFDLLVGTGMRLGEVEALRVADLRIGDQESRALVEDAKTTEGVRTVFIPEETTEVLLVHIEERGVRGTDLVFDLVRRTTQTEHTRACKLVGIHGYTLHDHRHTAAVRWARAGHAAQPDPKPS